MSKRLMRYHIESFLIVIPLALLLRTYVFGLYQVPSGSMETTMLVGERFIADKFTPLYAKPQRGDIISFDDPLYPYSDNQLLNWFQRTLWWGVSNWTKRVIGIPGDHIVGTIVDGKPLVHINGNLLIEPYVNEFPIIALYTGEGLEPFVYGSYDPEKTLDAQPFYKMTETSIAAGKKLALLGQQAPVFFPDTPLSDQEHPHMRKHPDIFDVVLGSNEYWVMGDNRLGSHDSRIWGPLHGSLIHGKIVWCLWSIDSTASWWLLEILEHPKEFFKKIRWGRCFKRVK